MYVTVNILCLSDCFAGESTYRFSACENQLWLDNYMSRGTCCILGNFQSAISKWVDNTRQLPTEKPPNHEKTVQKTTDSDIAAFQSNLRSSL